LPCSSLMRIPAWFCGRHRWRTFRTRRFGWCCSPVGWNNRAMRSPAISPSQPLRLCAWVERASRVDHLLVRNPRCLVANAAPAITFILCFRCFIPAASNQSNCTGHAP
jgi:hypothetical protein